MHKTTVNHLDNAVAEVFDAMLGERCLPEGTPALLPEGFRASVDFTGCLAGVCTVCFDPQAAADLTAALLGEDWNVLLDPAVEQARSADTVAELCNMIAGSWKSRLPPELAACSLSPPRICLSGGFASLSPAHVAVPTSSSAHWIRFYRFGNGSEIRSFGLELTLESR